MIEIDIGPNLVALGSFVLSWHGFFSFIAVATAVFLVGRWAPMARNPSRRCVLDCDLGDCRRYSRRQGRPRD